MVSAFGSVRSEGCAILVFAQELGEAAGEWTRMLRKSAKAIRRVAGREVFEFPSTVVMESVFKPKPWQGTFLLQLSPNTLLCAFSDKYLDELLTRIDQPQKKRALAEELPEWKYVKPNAPVWMLRHFPKGQSKEKRRLLDGITWSLTKDRLNVVYVPAGDAAQSIEKRVLKQWNPEEYQSNARIEITKDGMVVMSCNVKNPGDGGTGLLLMNLCWLMGLGPDAE